MGDVGLWKVSRSTGPCRGYNYWILQKRRGRAETVQDKMKVIWWLFILNLQNMGLVLGVGHHKYSRHDFPPGFVFGSATTAYQVEGAASQDGRTPSIWDTFTHAGYANGATGDVAVDQYHKYKEDVKIMAEMSLDAYSFSISWSRLIPRIQPHVTLTHTDLPQALEDEYGGWLNPRIVKDFTAYVDACFREFGDRVSYWITVNEPNVFALGGYDQGVTPPRRCSPPFGVNCTRGNSSSEPYVVVHNILLAHASATRLYKRTYQEKQKGLIGISIFTFGVVPNTNSTEDVMAAKRLNDFTIGWIANPLVFGDYPDAMKKLVGSRIPTFTNHESELVKGSFDFLGVVHYTTLYVQDDPGSLLWKQRDYYTDIAANITNFEEIFVTAEVSCKILLLLSFVSLWDFVFDKSASFRSENQAQFDLGRHIESGISAGIHRENGSDTRGYFAWLFLDVLELLDGYGSSFGLYYVDLDDPDLKRQPKLSSYRYSHFLKGGSVSPDILIQLNTNFSASRGHFFQ
ncbi:hypothetical protein V6N13_071398 [Hibiscus sabdariffa]